MPQPVGGWSSSCHSFLLPTGEIPTLEVWSVRPSEIHNAQVGHGGTHGQPITVHGAAQNPVANFGEVPPNIQRRWNG